VIFIGDIGYLSNHTLFGLYGWYPRIYRVEHKKLINVNVNILHIWGLK